MKKRSLIHEKWRKCLCSCLKNWVNRRILWKKNIVRTEINRRARVSFMFAHTPILDIQFPGFLHHASHCPQSHKATKPVTTFWVLANYWPSLSWRGPPKTRSTWVSDNDGQMGRKGLDLAQKKILLSVSSLPSLCWGSAESWRENGKVKMGKVRARPIVKGYVQNGLRGRGALRPSKDV